MHTQPSIVLLPGIHTTFRFTDCKKMKKLCITFVSIMYCLLYKQVQSATAIITDTPLSDTAKRSVTSSESLLKMVQKNARLGFCEVQTS